ncbi:MAG: hypothetical protein IJB47_04855 [Oscillospiraceae bacterium]|nr:hypothetical protein [Oscillospiraceae bacterium]
MSRMQLLEWIGGLDEDLLERSELPAKRNRPYWIPLVAAAACLCLICGAFWGLGGGKKVAMDNAANGDAPLREDESSLIGSRDPMDGIMDSDETKTERPSAGTVSDTCQNQSYWAQHSLEQADSPEITVFFSRQELDTWLESHPELTGQDRDAVLKICEKYDASYFTKQALLLTRVGGANDQTDYAKKGFLHKVAGKLETDWMLYLFETEEGDSASADGCRYVFTEADPDCAIAPGDTVAVQLLPWEETPRS